MKAAIYGTSTTAPLQRASRMENAFWFSQGKDNFQVMVFQKVIYVVNVNDTHGFLRDFCLSHIVARLCEPNHDAPRTRHNTPIGSWHLRFSVMVPRGTQSSPPKVRYAAACHILGKAAGCTGQSGHLFGIWREKEWPIHTSQYHIISQSYYLISIFTLEVEKAWKTLPPKN